MYFSAKIIESGITISQKLTAFSIAQSIKVFCPGCKEIYVCGGGAFNKTMVSYGISPNSFGKHMVAAAYSQEGADWVDALMIYIAENQRIFNSSINSIPGVNSMELEGTYLCWVDFSNTGMQNEEVLNRVEKVAQIAINRGATFGTGGETFLRFN